MIRLDAVELARNGQTVLDGVSLAVGPAEMLVVQGTRATGKSALAAIAAARLSPDKGRVAIAERDVTALQRSSLPFVRRNVGWLPAPAPLDPHETVLENVMLALAVRGETIAAAEAAALKALRVLRLDSLVARLAASLSAGERQLVALARAIAGPAPLVVVDEPALALGTADHPAIAAALSAVREDGAAVLCTTGDEALAGALAAGGARRARLEAGRLHGAAPTFTLVPRATPTEVPVARGGSS